MDLVSIPNGESRFTQASFELKDDSLAPIRCTVRFLDRKMAEHTTEVQAATLYEAACRAFANLKAHTEVIDEVYKAHSFIVEVHQSPRRFLVCLEKLYNYLDPGKRCRLDNPKKRALRGLMDAR
jgi:hypothetical protein